MADNWQPGDLALCVSEFPTTQLVRVGGVYVVEGVNDDWVEIGELGLYFVDVLSSGPGWDGWNAERFRKIHPLNEAEHAAAMRELNAPVREPVAQLPIVKMARAS